MTEPVRAADRGWPQRRADGSRGAARPARSAAPAVPSTLMRRSDPFSHGMVAGEAAPRGAGDRCRSSRPPLRRARRAAQERAGRPERSFPGPSSMSALDPVRIQSRSKSARAIPGSVMVLSEQVDPLASAATASHHGRRQGGGRRLSGEPSTGGPPRCQRALAEGAGVVGQASRVLLFASVAHRWVKPTPSGDSGASLFRLDLSLWHSD